jgi:Pregnancy-associated plasma protein-A/IPT/TIG domain
MRRPTWKLVVGAVVGLVLAAAATTASASAGGIAVSSSPGSAPCLLPAAFNSVTALKTASGLKRDAVPNEYDLPTPSVVSPFFTGPRTIEVYFHVIHDGSTGNIPDVWITHQIDILNDAYAGTGAASGSVDTGFRFHLAGTTRTDNPDWYNQITPNSSAERDMKTALRQGGYWDLNLYSADLGDFLLGWATFPVKKPKAKTLAMDGVVLLDQSLPDGNAGSGPPDNLDYHEGDTATHEVGHWLSLYHTFQGGCKGKGDYVDDTPYEAGPNFDCTPIDSCTRDDVPNVTDDPIHNFMDYGDDICLDEFTAGQTDRMHANWDALRNLAPTVKSFKPNKGPVGTSVTITGSALSDASAVRFNGVPASLFTIVNDTTITATVPGGATTGKVTVVGPNGTTDSKKNFTVTL